MARRTSAPQGGTTGSDLAREALKRTSLEGWRIHGTLKEAARTCGRSPSSVQAWLRTDPEYRRAVQSAVDEFALTAGQEAHNALLQHVRDAMSEKMVLARKGVEGGKPVKVYERVQLNPSLVRLLLTRADTRFTHPAQSVSVTVRTVGEWLDSLPPIDSDASQPADAAPNALPAPQDMESAPPGGGAPEDG